MNYGSAFKHWLRFVKKEKIDPKNGISALMLEDFVAMRYLEHQADQSEMKFNSMKGELASIRYWAMRNNYPYPPAEELERFFFSVKGYKRLCAAVTHHLAFPSSALVKALQCLMEDGSDYACLQHVVLSFFFCAMPRVSEATAESAKAPSALRWNQVKFWPDFDIAEYVEIRWGKTKTDQDCMLGRPAILSCTCCTHICGFHALWLWRQHRQNALPSDPVFAFEDGRAIRRSHVDEFVKEACRLGGVSDGNYTPHTLRAGGATWLFDAGVPLPLVESAGRWAPNSDALRRAYVKIEHVDANKKIAEQLRKTSKKRSAIERVFMAPSRSEVGGNAL